MPTETHSPLPAIVTEHWQPLRFFNLYRLGLVLLFLALGITGHLPSPLGSYDERLFIQITLLYLLATLVAIFTLGLQRPRFETQLHLQVAFDIIFITLLMHASGGISSGVGMLMVVSVANHGMLASGRMPSLFAALATIALLIQQTYSATYLAADSFNYPRTGLFGVVLFATAILIHAISTRARQSEQLAEQRGVDLANMAQLTEYALSQLRDGVIAVDSECGIRLINQAAQQMLAAAPLQLRPTSTLNQLNPTLAKEVQQWWRDPRSQPPPFELEDGRELLPHLIRIGDSSAQGTLILIKDVAESNAQVQQLKLASLGRLTAGIAHEIRNPLGAISHASELLGESAKLTTADHRLIEIIVTHTKRLNAIVESILLLGRRSQKTLMEEIHLDKWLHSFIDSFGSTTAVADGALALQSDHGAASVHFDSGQLRQIIWNLVQNGIRYADPQQLPQVILSIHPSSDGMVQVDVIDNGPGVATKDEGHLFEPFFTTEPSGTGLGLYISRTLAQSNGAQLDYRRTPEGKSCFVLKIPIARSITMD